MASRAVQAIIEENPFAIDLYNFLFGALNHARGETLSPVLSHFNGHIGFAVLYMQFVSRDSLRDVLKGLHIRTTEHALHVTRKLCRARRKRHPDQVLQVFLECCAIIIEVYLYCSCGIQIPVETCMVFLSWNFVFNRRRIEEFLSIGGWEELTNYAVLTFQNKINLIDHQLDVLDYPYENFITNQTFDDEAEAMVADFEESFLCFHAKFEVDIRQRYRQSKASSRMKRVEDKLIATNRMGTPEAEAMLASQNRIAMRSGRNPIVAVDWVDDISPYNSSEEEDYDEEEDFRTVSELCTRMSDAQIASSATRKKKKQKRKKKPSQTQIQTEEPSDPSLEPETQEQDTVPQTFASSSRPLKVPIQSPATSPTKSDKPAKIPAASEVSPGQSKAGKKGKKKK